MKSTIRFETRAIRDQVKRSLQNEHSVPIFETSSFVFDSAEDAQAVFAEEKEGNIYTRYSNPNTDELISKLCILEKAEDGIATASGMAALFISMASLLRPGDHILSCRQIYGATHMMFTELLSRWGISHSYADINDKKDWEKNILPTTRMLFAETPSNPGLDLIDLKWLGNLASKHDLYLLIDNTFATPYLQNPMDYGADVVIHSTTKYIDGQGRTISGVVLGTKEVMKDIHLLSKIIGPTMSPFTAWLLSKSLETLSVRMERHCSNALRLAEYLHKNPEVTWVRYPYLPSHPQYKLAKKQMKLGGGMVTFELKGTPRRSHRFINALQLASITSNLGDTRTIVTHPSTTTHSKLTAEEKKQSGVTECMIRVSVGLENIDDIIADFDQAIQKSKQGSKRK
jgi:O-succinylhomoserine sulfhydrylase